MTPHVCLLISLLVGWSVIIFQKGVKLHFHAPIGALVYCTSSSQHLLHFSIVLPH